MITKLCPVMVILHNEAALTNSHMPVVEAVVMVSCNYPEAVDGFRGKEIQLYSLTVISYQACAMR